MKELLGKCNCNRGEFEIKEQNTESDTSEAKLVYRLEDYHKSAVDLDKKLLDLDVEIFNLQVTMDQVGAKGTCKSGVGGANSCFQPPPPGGPPVPPGLKSCGLCPPCPAPCNPAAPPTPAEKEVKRLTIQLRQTEENFKTKVTECAMLRADLMKKKQDLEKETINHRDCQGRLRELEMRFEGLNTHTNMLLGTAEQALENEVNVRSLKRCYKEVKQEAEELRILLKEQNEQLQDYRVKYLQAQQLVEEQKRQMDVLDMDNVRISEQINLEIQKVKLKFQEKLQELAPLPDLLKATQMKLKDAQQSQAIAEHNAEQLARELNCAREKVHALLHNAVKPPEKPDKMVGDDKHIQMLTQKITQMTEANTAQKNELERLKMNIIRMEESVLANDKRLQEKMHECAALGGELDRSRQEAAMAIARANERTETTKRCLQTTVAEMERQLTFLRGQLAHSNKEREELQRRMQCQINRLVDNFDQAQHRILGLKSQVSTLRKARPSSDEEDDDDLGEKTQQCACKSVLEIA